MLHPNLRTILCHALGLDDKGRGREYRNYFVAGGADLPKCRELVALGCMTEHFGNVATGGDPFFVVTDEGKRKARERFEGCEWSPTRQRAAYEDDPHCMTVRAEMLVGANGQWRLCRECAALPAFKRFKKQDLQRPLEQK